MTRDQGVELAELLAPFKGAAVGLGLVIVADDVASKKILAAYELCPPPVWSRPRTKMPEDPRQRWAWLWTGIAGEQPDGTAPWFLAALARAAGVAEQTAYGKWPALMTSRLVYPDGTISSEARGLLHAFVMQHLPKPQAQPREAKSKKET